MIRHAVATAYVFNKDFTRILLVKHKTLGCWLPPGGHVDINESFQDAAIRELQEETGIVGQLIDVNQQMVLAKDYSQDKRYRELLRPFSMIEELIPKNYKEAEHKHIDASYVIITDITELPHVNDRQISQSKWFPVVDLSSINTMKNVIGIVNSILKYLEEKPFKEWKEANYVK